MKSDKKVLITKASGVIVPFSEEKLKASLKRSGADEIVIADIVDEIRGKLYSGIPTKKIYKLAFNKLKEKSKPSAAKYQLKRAIMELGPSGYPFECFIGEILKSQGYLTSVGQFVNGECVTHEIDVIAEKDNYYFMIECKYHNLPGTMSDVKVPLYIQARFKDVEKKWLEIAEHQNKIHQGWVVTNTKFTTDAIKYGTCAGLHLLSWDYPEKENLKNQIDTLRLYPVTCLTSLTKVEKQKLLDAKIVLCKDIYENQNLLMKAGVKQTRISTILNEAGQLLNNGTEK